MKALRVLLFSLVTFTLVALATRSTARAGDGWPDCDWDGLSSCSDQYISGVNDCGGDPACQCSTDLSYNHCAFSYSCPDEQIDDPCGDQ
jgi:hypothetical protein